MATAADIDTRAYLGEVRALVERFALPLESVELVPNIQRWCEARGLPEDSSFRIGKIVRNTETGRYVILLAERIDQNSVLSVTGAMELRGFGAEVATLSDPLAFVRHLALHEIAHGLDDTRSEAACDRWAFEQLEKLPSNPAAQSDAFRPALSAPTRSAPGRER